MITRVGLVILPLTIMLMASILGFANLTNTQTTQVQIGNQTINEQTQNVDISANMLSLITIVSILIGSFMAIAIAVSVKVLGTGISGQAVTIIFVCGIGLCVWSVLSILSFSVFTSIIYFGIPLYAGLSLMYLVGLVGMTTSGGD